MSQLMPTSSIFFTASPPSFFNIVPAQAITDQIAQMMVTIATSTTTDAAAKYFQYLFAV